MEITEQNKKVFLEYFKGREDYCAFQEQNIYRPIKRNFSDHYLEVHLKNLATFGIYVLTRESKCHFICIDIDIPKDELKSIDFKEPQTKFSYLQRKLFKLLEVLYGKLGINENAVLMEDTGGRGYHIWLFFEEPIPGEEAVKLYTVIKTYVDIDFEFFPKQPNLNKKLRYGNLIKLPLGTHQAYESQSNFFRVVDSKIVYPSSFEENFERLSHVEKLPYQTISLLLETHHEIFSNDKVETFHEEKIIPDSERFYYNNDLDFLFEKCIALNDLKIKAEKGIEFSYHEIFHFANILLSVEGSENFIIESIRKSYGSKFSYTHTQRELDNIKTFYPSSCKKLIAQGICKGYCNETIEETNLDSLLPNTTPLSFWLKSSKKKQSVNPEQILDKIAELENIKNAYWKLKKYHRDEDALFFDEFDFEHFEKDFEANVRYISGFLKNREKIPFTKHLKIKIPKKVNEEHEMQYRQMAYSNIMDQVIVQAIFNVISIIFEKNFQSSSYGYRFNAEKVESDDIFYDWKEYYPKFRNTVLAHIRKPEIHYWVSCDIKGYYDHINHKILLEQVKKYVHDDYIIRVLREILNLYQFEEGQESNKGLPQGPAYARILANLYLNDFDQEIIKYSSGYFRYVDDLFLLFKKREDAEKGLNKVAELLDRIGLLLADDEQKKPQILETTNEEKIIEKLDSLRYGIFEEFKFVDYLDIEEVQNFYSATEKHQVSTKTIDDVLEINNKLPSILYLISKDYLFSLPLKKEIPRVVEYLVEKACFYPKRLKYIFYEIIELLQSEGYALPIIYRKLDDTHKIYFILTLYRIYKKDGKYEQDLKQLTEFSLELDNPFLKGFAIIIAKNLQIEVPLKDPDFIRKVLNCDSYFPKVKLFQSINFFKLPPDTRDIFSETLLPKSPYIERKYFLSNLTYQSRDYAIDLFLSNLIVSDVYLLLVECCKLFSTLQSYNPPLFNKLEQIITEQTKYKKISISCLTDSLFERFTKGSGKAELTNLIKLYTEQIQDPEIKNALTNTLRRIEGRKSPSETEFYKYLNEVNAYNECILCKHRDAINTNYHYVEFIPCKRLEDYNLDEKTLENALKDLVMNNIFPSLHFEYYSTQNEVRIKYTLPQDFQEMSVYSFPLVENDILHALALVENIYKKAQYFYKIFKTIPRITSSNLFLNKSKDEVLFKSVGTILCYKDTINSTVINVDDQNEIPLMLSLLLKEVFFQRNEETFEEFNKASKVGIHLFLAHFIQRMLSKKPALRYSYSRYHYLIQQLKSKNIESKYEISFFYFYERFKVNLFDENQNDIQWFNVCKALERLYADFAVAYGSVNFDEIVYYEHILINFNIPAKLHYLSKLLLNISLNIEHNLRNEDDWSVIGLFELINHYAILCIELISFFKIGITTSTKTLLNISPTEKITLKMGNYSLIFEENDAEAIHSFLHRDKNAQNIFAPLLPFTLLQISIVFLVKVFNLQPNNDIFIVENTGTLPEEDFELLAYTLLIKLPAIQRKVDQYTQEVLSDLKTNQNFVLSEADRNLKHDMLWVCQSVNKIRKSLKYTRYYGKNVPEKSSLDIHCKRHLHWKTFKTTVQTLDKIPLINMFPASPTKCSWDVSDNGDVINLVIPKDPINKLVSKLKNGEVFKLSRSSFKKLKKEGIPDKELISLKSLANQEFTLEKEFLSAVKNQIGKEQTDKYGKHILKHVHVQKSKWLGHKLDYLFSGKKLLRDALIALSIPMIVVLAYNFLGSFRDSFGKGSFWLFALLLLLSSLLLFLKKNSQALKHLFENIHYQKKMELVSYSDIPPEEIVQLAEGLIYRGKEIDRIRIETWLRQFGDEYSQRLAFKLLCALKKQGYYSTAKFNLALQELFEKVIAMRYGWAKVVDEKNKVKNVLVTHIDPMGKSGPSVVTEFRRENNIFYQFCGSLEEIAEILAGKSKISQQLKPDERWLLIMVDDFVGTGNGASGDIIKALKILDKKCPEWESCCYPFYAVVCGFEEAAESIEAKSGNRVKVAIAHPLEEKDRAFSPNAGIFADNNERELAKELFFKIGSKLEKKHPLGHEGSEALIVFPNNVPNNTLPVFHKENGKYDGKPWIPLFPRQ